MAKKPDPKPDPKIAIMTVTDTPIGFDCEIDGDPESPAFRLLEILWEACVAKFSDFDPDEEIKLN